MSGESAANKSGEFEPRELHADAASAPDVLARVGERAPDLVAQWIAESNAAAVAAAAESASGAARKAARRGLNVLKSRGVKIPQVPKVARLATAPLPPTYEAWMLPPDGSGTLLLVIVAQSPAQRLRATFVSMNDVLGLRRVDVAELSQSQLKDSLNRAASQGQVRPVPVPVAWARWRIAEARRRHAETGRIEPLGLTTARELIEPAPSEVPPHPFDEEGLVLADEDAQEMAQGSGRLHALPEFRSWLPVRGAVDQMLVAVGSHFTGPEPPAQEALREHLEQELAAATDRYFSPQRRDQLMLAMKDCALSVLARDGEQAALEVVATMKAIERAGLITHPPHEVGFLRGFFDKGVAVLASQNNGQLKIPIRAPAPVPSEPATEGSEPAGEDGASPSAEAEAAAAPTQDDAAQVESAPTQEHREEMVAVPLPASPANVPVPPPEKVDEEWG